jgi:hypothetical protein
MSLEVKTLAASLPYNWIHRTAGTTHPVAWGPFRLANPPRLVRHRRPHFAMCKRLVRSMSFSSRTTSLFLAPIERPDAQKPSSPALARGHCRSGPPDSRFQLRLVRAGLAERRVRLVARTTCAPERRTPAGRTIVRPPSPPAVWPATRSSSLPSGVLRNAHEL